ncbi:MAG: family 16 glycoside hydrolase [Bacteroidota bacterium]
MKPSFWLVLAAMLVFGACKNAAVPPPSAPKFISTLPATDLSLADLSAFATPTANWMVVGKASVPWDEKVEAFSTAEGKDILVNHPTEEAGGALRTQMEHGDLDLSFEFMMPKGSNSGVYLQGRYEIQLLDSWGKTEVTFGDCGGIYQRWDDTKPEGEKGFEGTAPALNAAKAPGLWQEMQIRFQAPVFDVNGTKITNARVISVVHNGKQIHREVELTGPTRGSFFEQEAGHGPLIIQGDHGPVAFRNIRYKLFEAHETSLDSLQYAYYEIKTNKGTEDYIKDFDLASLSPVSAGAIDSISRNQSERRDNFILHYSGKINVPEEGEYLFKTQVGGGMLLSIDGEELILADGERAFNDPPAHGLKKLTAGAHTFELTYLQNHRFWRNGLGLWVEGPGIDFQPLHAQGSVPPYRPPSPIWIETDERPKIMRGFVMFGEEKLTHTASIGSPDGVHFNYDLNQSKLLNVWRGPFLDVSPMWRGRGESQLAVPGGAALAMSGKASFIVADDIPTAWPDSLAEDVVFKGYDLDRDGMPTFRFGMAKGEVSDHFSVKGGNLRREISAKDLNQFIQVLLVEASEIEALSEDLYAVDDRSFYLRLIDGKAELKSSPSGQRLVHNLSTPITYELIW